MTLLERRHSRRLLTEWRAAIDASFAERSTGFSFAIWRELLAMEPRA